MFNRFYILPLGFGVFIDAYFFFSYPDFSLFFFVGMNLLAVFLILLFLFFLNFVINFFFIGYLIFFCLDCFFKTVESLYKHPKFVRVNELEELDEDLEDDRDRSLIPLETHVRSNVIEVQRVPNDSYYGLLGHMVDVDDYYRYPSYFCPYKSGLIEEHGVEIMVFIYQLDFEEELYGKLSRLDYRVNKVRVLKRIGTDYNFYIRYVSCLSIALGGSTNFSYHFFNRGDFFSDSITPIIIYSSYWKKSIIVISMRVYFRYFYFYSLNSMRYIRLKYVVPMGRSTVSCYYFSTPGGSFCFIAKVESSGITRFPDYGLLEEVIYYNYFFISKTFKLLKAARSMDNSYRISYRYIDRRFEDFGFYSNRSRGFHRIESTFFNNICYVRRDDKLCYSKVNPYKLGGKRLIHRHFKINNPCVSQGLPVGKWKKIYRKYIVLGSYRLKDQKERRGFKVVYPTEFFFKYRFIRKLSIKRYKGKWGRKMVFEFDEKSETWGWVPSMALQNFHAKCFKGDRKFPLRPFYYRNHFVTCSLRVRASQHCPSHVSPLDLFKITTHSLNKFKFINSISLSLFINRFRQVTYGKKKRYFPKTIRRSSLVPRRAIKRLKIEYRWIKNLRKKFHPGLYCQQYSLKYSSFIDSVYSDINYTPYLSLSETYNYILVVEEMERKAAYGLDAFMRRVRQFRMKEEFGCWVPASSICDLYSPYTDWDAGGHSRYVRPYSRYVTDTDDTAARKFYRERRRNKTILNVIKGATNFTSIDKDAFVQKCKIYTDNYDFDFYQNTAVIVDKEREVQANVYLDTISNDYDESSCDF